MSFFSGLKSSFTSLVETSGLKEVVQSTVKSVTEAVNEVAQTLSLDALQEENSGRKALYEGLDVTYLTSRVVAMTFPTFPDSRIRSRNDAGAVRALLEERHGEHYMVWNCSEESYDAAFFGGRVIEVKFPGYPAPPLDMLFRLCTSIGNWLAASDQNVAVLHCMTGKGRTCTIAACVLAWLGEFSSPLPALAYVCERRSRDLHTLRVRGKHGAGPAQTSVSAGPSTAGAVAGGITTVGNLLLGPSLTGSGGGANDAFLSMPLDPIAALLCPSQQRYVRYFGLACCDGVKPRTGGVASDGSGSSSSSSSSSSLLVLRRVVVHGSVALERIPIATSSASSAGAAASSSSSSASDAASGAASGSGVSQHLRSAKEAAQSAASSVLNTLATVAGVDNQHQHGSAGDGSGSLGGGDGSSGDGAIDIKLLPPSQVGYRPSLQIFKGSRLVHNTLWESGASNPSAMEGWVSVEDGAARFSLDVPVAGDCLIRCRHVAAASASGQPDRETIWRAAFHAGYILTTTTATTNGAGSSGADGGCSLRLSKRQLDLACDDERVDDGFTVELLFAPMLVNSSNEEASSTSPAAADTAGATEGAIEPAQSQQAQAQVEGAVKLSSAADAEALNKAAAAEGEFWAKIADARNASLSRAQEAKAQRARALQSKLAAAKEGGLTAAKAAASSSSAAAPSVSSAAPAYDDALEVDAEADPDDVSSSLSLGGDYDASSAYAKQALVARIERRLKRVDADIDIEPSVSGRGPSLGWIIKHAPPKAASAASTAAGPKASTSKPTASSTTAAPTATIAMPSGSGPASRRGSSGGLGGTASGAAGSATAGAGGAGASSNSTSISAFDRDLADLEELERELGIGTTSPAKSEVSSGSATAAAPASAAKPASSMADGSAAASAPAQSKAAATKDEEEDDMVDELEKYLNL